MVHATLPRGGSVLSCVPFHPPPPKTKRASRLHGWPLSGGGLVSSPPPAFSSRRVRRTLSLVLHKSQTKSERGDRSATRPGDDGRRQGGVLRRGVRAAERQDSAADPRHLQGQAGFSG